MGGVARSMRGALSPGWRAAAKQGGNNAGPIERLRVVGKDLVSTLTGQPVYLRGINWGKWDYWRPGDGLLVKSWGCNFVRIPLRWWGTYSNDGIDSREDGQPGHVSVDHLLRHDAMWADAEAAGLWVQPFIDSNCGQNGLQADGITPQYCDPTGIWPDGHNFFRDPAMKALFFEVWAWMATRNKARNRLAMNEGQPEITPQGITEATIRAYYDELDDVIASTGCQAPMVVGPKSYAIPNAENAYNAARPNRVITGNLFTFTGQDQAGNIQSLTDRLNALIAVRDAHNVPIMVQQWGTKTSEEVGARVYQNHCASILHAARVHSTYWQMDDGDGGDQGYGVYSTQAGVRVLKTARHADLVANYWQAA